MTRDDVMPGGFERPRRTVQPLMPPSFAGASAPTPPPTPVPTTTSGSATSGNYFSDPLLQGYLNFGHQAIGRLSGPTSINPTLQSAIDALTRISGSGAPRMDTSFLHEFGNTVRNRQAQLAQPGYSQSQQDLLRTNVSDPLMAARDAEHARVDQMLAARGIDPKSGIGIQAHLDTDRSFQQQRTTGERQLATAEIQQDEQRKNQSVEIGNLLAQLGLSTEGMNLQSQSANRGAQLSAAGQLGGIGEGLQQEPLQRLMSAMGIYGNMAQLPFQANANAINSMNAINGQQVPQADNMSAIIQLLLELSHQGEGTYQDALTNQGNAWSTFGQALPGLIQTFSSLYNQQHGAAPRIAGAGSGSGGGTGASYPYE